MIFDQPVEETMSEIICHMLKRREKISMEERFAIGQEKREWITCIKDRKQVSQSILFINTSSFEKNVKQNTK